MDCQRKNRSQRRSQRKQRNQQRQRNQQGGATYAVNDVAPIQTASGVPLAVNSPVNTYCSWGDYRVPPHIGGSWKKRQSQRKQKQRQQRGGCGCGLPMAGGGGGTGGYGFELTNDLGKVYTSLPVGPCPAQPVATPLTQAGGMAPFNDSYVTGASSVVPPPGSDAALREIVSYPSGYALGHPYSTKNESAHFLEPVRYDRSCMGGGSRKKRSHRKSKKSRKSHKRSKKH